MRGKRGADDFELPAHMVMDIEWSELPEEFLAGKGAMGRGDFAAAASWASSASSASLASSSSSCLGASGGGETSEQQQHWR